MNNMNSVSSSSTYKNIPAAPYVSFRNDMDDEDDFHSQSGLEQPVASMISGVGGGRSNGDIELVANNDMSSTKGIHSVGGPSQLQSQSRQPKRVRLRAVESERDYFLKLMNIDTVRVLLIVQVAASLVILLSQVILYAIPTDDHKVLDYIGIGIWAPILFFAPTCWLTYMTMRSPSGCSVGCALACNVISVLAGLILIIFSIVHLTQHGRFARWRDEGEEYNPEVAGRVFTSFMILAAVSVTVASMIGTIQYCRMTCCGRVNAHEPMLYDVEIVK